MSRTRSQMRSNLSGDDQRLISEYITVNDDPRFSMCPLVHGHHGSTEGALTKTSCTVSSPAESPYGSAAIEFVVVFPPGYPRTQPKVVAVPHIHHPNLSRVQEVSDILGQPWTVSRSIHDVLQRLWSLLAKPDLNMPNKDTAIAAEYTLEPAAYRKKARASVVASGAAASTQKIEVLQGKLRRRAEALIDHFIDSKTSYSTPTATDAVRDSTSADSSFGDEWGASACERDEERRLGRAIVLTSVVGIGVFALGLLVGTKVTSNRL